MLKGLLNVLENLLIASYSLCLLPSLCLHLLLLPLLKGSAQVYQCCCSEIYFLVLTNLTCTLVWSVVRWRSIHTPGALTNAILVSLLNWYCTVCVDTQATRLATCHLKVTKMLLGSFIFVILDAWYELHLTGEILNREFPSVGLVI